MGKKTTQPDRPDWNGLVRRQIDFECRSVNEEERSLEVVASTDSLDSHGDVVEQTFNLKRYKKNPVVLWMHNAFGTFDGSGAEDFLPIGRAEDVKIENGQLTAKIVFVSGDGPDSVAEKVWRRVQQKVLRAVSIGFRPGKITEEKRDGGTVFRLSENELYEISVVPIPSNPDAVAKALEREREHFGRAAANQTADSGKAKPNMDEELKKAIEAKAVADKALEAEKSARETAEKKAEELTAKVKQLESDVTAEKAVNAKLSDSIAKADAQILAFKAEIDKGEIEKLVGVKITPAEREEYLDLAKTAGIERVKALIEKRPDLKLLDPVQVENKNLPSSELPPPPADADASAEILSMANKAVAN